MPFARCSSALVSAAVGASDLAGLIVLEESFVETDAGVRPRTGSCDGEVSGRPLGTSSDCLTSAVDGRLGLDEGCSPLIDISFDNLLRSKDGRAKKVSVGVGPSMRDEELDGLEGGEGGA